MRPLFAVRLGVNYRITIDGAVKEVATPGAGVVPHRGGTRREQMTDNTLAIVGRAYGVIEAQMLAARRTRLPPAVRQHTARWTDQGFTKCGAKLWRFERGLRGVVKLTTPAAVSATLTPTGPPPPPHSPLS